MILYSVEDEQSRTRFRGTFEKGEIKGLGMMEWQDGAKYCGTWKRSLPHGYGEERYPDGSVYQGQLRRDLRHGMGVMMQPSGGGNPEHFSIVSAPLAATRGVGLRRGSVRATAVALQVVALSSTTTSAPTLTLVSTILSCLRSFLFTRQCSGEWRQGMQHGVAIDTLEDTSKNLVSPMMFSLYR